jgi:hypothetical protein
MRTIKFAIWRRDPNSRLWYLTALLCFWFRYPKTLRAASFPKPPSGLEKTMDSFRRYGEELEILEHDLTECINEFQAAHETLYRDPDNLELKKFAIVYHVDNFYVRVHKLIENVYRLLALAVGLDFTRRRRQGEPSLRKEVREGLSSRKLQKVFDCLRTFEENKWVHRAVEARNLFVHEYREESEWPMLHPRDRFQEPEDPMARYLRRIDQGTDLDRFAARKANELSQALRATRRFRDRIVKELSDVVGALKRTYQDPL